jgi:2-desacetyl-2-hydroxyethyl bacteriochlorophyllide A dehydrogenase
MQAALFDGSSKFKIIDKDIPAIEENEVLVKVSACGICGTDIKILAGKSYSRPPVILGHEFCGKVVEIGPEVKNIEPGDFVSVDPNISCGVCSFCREGQINLCKNLAAIGVDIDGGFAEYCAVPEKQCYPLNFDSPINAALMEPLSCALYGIKKADVKPGEDVIILGAGMIGIMMIKLFKLEGAARIFVLEIDEVRRNYARANGANLAFDPHAEKSMHELSQILPDGADVVIECAGSMETIKQSIDLAKRGGRVVYFGVAPRDEEVSLKPHKIFNKDLTISGSLLNPFTYSKAEKLITNGKIDFSHLDIAKFPLEKINEAIQNQKEKQDLKAMIFFE